MNATQRSPSAEPLERLGVGVCVRSPDGAVLFQNETSQSICGDALARVCDGACARFCAGDAGSEHGGPQFARGERLHKSYCDLVVRASGDGWLTLLFPLAGRIEKHRQAFLSKGLTPRETEIALLAAIGRSNKEIMRETGLTKATVRTHLNRIHQKLPSGLLERMRGA